MTDICFVCGKSRASMGYSIKSKDGKYHYFKVHSTNCIEEVIKIGWYKDCAERKILPRNDYS